MNKDRITRINELLKREIGNALYKIVDEQDFDLSAVTVTRVSASPNLRSAKVYVSIRNHEQERRHMLAQIVHHRAEIQNTINRNLVIKYTPRLTFVLDESVERGDRVLKLLQDLEAEDEGGEESP